MGPEQLEMRILRGVRFVACVLAAIAALSCAPDAPPMHATLWPEADALFHGDARWIGGDGAYSIALGGERTLWLFGDSFIASTPRRVRRESRMIRNSIAIQTGLDPSRAFLQFHWRDADKQAESFFPEPDGKWLWPAAGIRLDDVLLLFLERVRTPEGDPTGFEGAGWTARLIENPDEDPLSWRIVEPKLPSTSGPQLGEAVVREGEHLYVYATDGATHTVTVARYAVADARAGDLTKPAWWTGDGYAVGGTPETVLGIGAPEFSVHRDAALGKLVMVDSQGYGTTTIAIRVADQHEGPWSRPRDVMRPPESHIPGRFNYAAKGHPELFGADLVVTYVPSTFDPPPEALEDALYYPRFVRLWH